MKLETQLAVFLDNRPGLLARTCEALAEKNINIVALSVLDSMDHAVVRMIVDRLTEAKAVLGSLHATVLSQDVLVLDVENHAGALARIAEQLTAAGINIEYAYGTAQKADATQSLVLRTNDLEATVSVLE